MSESKTPGTSTSQTDEPKREQSQQAQDNRVIAAPRPLQQPRPGRKPLFRT